jgi:uncharacterized protein (UPF0276 family)
MFHGYVGHGSNIADADFSERRDNDEQRDYFKRANTPYVSTHINRSFEDPATEEEVTERIKNNIQFLKDEFGMRVILENVPYHPKKAYNKFMVMPEYIKKSVYENDCGFLFDIGHARAAAERLDIPFNEYVSRLPMDKLVEIHLAGSMKTKSGGITPNHSKMHEEDYEFLEWAIQNCPTLETITFEYGPIDQTETIEETIEYVPSIESTDNLSYQLNGTTAGTDNFNNYYVLEQLIIPQTITKFVPQTPETTEDDTEEPTPSVVPLPVSLSEYEVACVYVEYTIGTEVFKSFTPLSNIFSNEATYNFEGGKQYTLNIIIGPKPIKFTAVVSEWIEGKTSNLPMD